jgi:hypothetical protein
MISKAWINIYLDKTILVLTLLRPSSSVRVVLESLGQVVVRPSVSGPPLGTSHQVRVLFFRPSAFCSASDLSSRPLHRTSYPGPPLRTALPGPLLGASNRTPSTSALPRVPPDLHQVTSPDITLVPDPQSRSRLSCFPTLRSDLQFPSPFSRITSPDLRRTRPRSVYLNRRFRPPPSRNPLSTLPKIRLHPVGECFSFSASRPPSLLPCSTVNSPLPPVKVDNHGNSPRHCAIEAHTSW